MSDALLPCPFCGAEAYVETPDETDEHLDDRSFVRVRCMLCAARIEHAKAQAVAMWNRRVAPPDLIDILRARVSEMKAKTPEALFAELVASGLIDADGNVRID